METPYASPLDENAKDQPGLHTKHYIAMEQDIHYQKGMKCQDCHTSIDVHGDGFLDQQILLPSRSNVLTATHTGSFPVELPLGFMDEFEATVASGSPRARRPSNSRIHGQARNMTAMTGFCLLHEATHMKILSGLVMRYLSIPLKRHPTKPLKKLAEEKQSVSEDLSRCRVFQTLNRMECYTC